MFSTTDGIIFLFLWVFSGLVHVNFCETVNELSLNTNSCISARYHCACNLVSVLLSSVVWLLLALTLVLVCNMSLATLLKPIWEALALLHNWWIFQIFQGEKFYRTGLCLLCMYKINFTMFQLVVPSFTCPHGQGILSFIRLWDTHPLCSLVLPVFLRGQKVYVYGSNPKL